ncbi:Rho guanine nucleotide exchange factor [Marasmius tenuissimus]|nr:Rho guanine nucleotide exchange factor [Marasmius tenuissimus]
MMNFATIFRGRRKASKPRNDPKNDPKNVQRIDQDLPMDLEMTESFRDAQRVVQDVLNDEDKYRKIIETKGDDAQECLDLLQVLAERSATSELQSSTLKMMLRLSQHSGLYPQCLVVKDVKRPSGRPVGGGGFGDVYKEKLGEQMVCLKLPRIFEDTEDSDAERLIKGYIREAIVWRQLNHPNLLPFIGVYYLDDEAPSQLCLISPWMDRGDLTRYLKRAQKQNADVNRLLLAYDVAAGLSYLHSNGIIHGDLKGLNVLINADERALIGDFGLSRVAETHTPGLFNSTTGAKGTIRWLSPELLKSNPPCRTSERSDIYAYAGVCYEIFTGKQPFYKLHDMAVFDAVVNREERPDRPEEARELTDPIWGIMVSCWQHDQQLRPSVGDVLARIGELKNPKTGAAVRTGSALDFSHAQVWIDVKCPPIDTAVIHRLLSERSNTPSIHDIDSIEIRSDDKAATGNIAHPRPQSLSRLTSDDFWLVELAREPESVAGSSEALDRGQAPSASYIPGVEGLSITAHHRYPPVRMPNHVRHISKVYADQLSSRHSGHALWHPEPNAVLPDCYKKDGIRIGDVGVITGEGRFDFLFNISRGVDDPINEYGVPYDFDEPLDLWRSVTVHSLGFERGMLLCGPGTSLRNIFSDDAITPGNDSGEDIPGHSRRISFEGEIGTVLSLPEGGRHLECDELRPIQAHMMQHWRSWYQFAKEHFGDDFDDTLFLVTGVEMASSWEIAVVQKRANKTELQYIPGEGLKLGSKLLRDFPQREVHSRCSSNRDGNLNQAVFIHGFSIDRDFDRVNPSHSFDPFNLVESSEWFL